MISVVAQVMTFGILVGVVLTESVGFDVEIIALLYDGINLRHFLNTTGIPLHTRRKYR